MGAWAHLDPEAALEQARARDAEPPRSPLHGVPVGVKDIIDTADLPTEQGSPIYAGRRPDADAACVRRLREAGAVVLGKTVTTEFATYQPAKTGEPARPRSDAGRLLERLGRRRGRRHGAARARQPDRGLHDPARVVLRDPRLQADARPRRPRRRAAAQRAAGHDRAVRPRAATPSRCWRVRCCRRGALARDPPRSRSRAPPSGSRPMRPGARPSSEPRRCSPPRRSSCRPSSARCPPPRRP